MKKLIFVLLVLSLSTAPLTALAEEKTLDLQSDADGWWNQQSREDKMLYTGLGAAAVIGVWGMLEWDYGSAGWYWANEQWFQEDTKYGGADKFGHFWFTYAAADGLTALYSSWGYEKDRANIYAAWTAWTVQAVMEGMDATSETQGFSWEDMIMNSLGALSSVVFERNPKLDDLIDLKVEYVLNETPEGIFDDYSNQFYSINLKLDGFDSLKNTWLRYVEFQAGYFSRGYNEDDQLKKRAVYAGVTLNFSRILYEQGWDKTGKALEYLQVPYSVPKASHYL